MKSKENRQNLLSLFGLTVSAAFAISTPIAMAADANEPFMVEQTQQSDAPNQKPQNWQVEQWAGATHRIKRFNPDGSNSSDLSGPSGLNNNDPDNGQNYRRRRRQFNNANMPDPTSTDPTNKQPDRITDNPQTDADGVRHFANGKHFDLSKMPLDKALDIAKAPNPNIRQGGNQFAGGNANSYTPTSPRQGGNQFGGGVAYLPTPSRPQANDFGRPDWQAGSAGAEGMPGASGQNGSAGGLYPPYRGGGFNNNNNWNQSQGMHRHMHRRARMLMRDLIQNF
jgi:hypothetical protein